ncbi:PAS domain-containing sensor histidine kinase [Lysobacter niastensis]|uniref:histidine kinase n=1 Tax=Lysobacter niastensis TaxID=380629 RepID=A0ABS0B505_9GAMM|nr:PAS domain-containing sensor histidine kinase [Lysobacter niastensis]MBF6023833.1 PAS domain S-box protein [Lysobacter niastensis]
MSWVSIAWPMLASASLTLGLIHMLFWLRQSRGWEHLAFALAAISVALLTIVEMQALHARSPDELARLIRWMHVPIAGLVVSLIWFVRRYLHLGNVKLAICAISLRMLALLLNFTTGENLNFDDVQAVGHVVWWGGETITYPIGTSNPWVILAQLSNVLLVVFLVDALLQARRLYDGHLRRSAYLVCGGWLLFIAIMVASAFLMTMNAARLPLLGSPSFVFVIAAMSYELGTNLIRSNQLAQRLSTAETRVAESQRNLDLAAGAAGFGLWEWDVIGDRLLASRQARRLLGLGDQPVLRRQDLLERVDPLDRDAVAGMLGHALETGYGERECRVDVSGNSMRWMQLRGKVEFDPEDQPVRMRGVAQDITERHSAEERFALLVEASPNAIVLAEESGAIALVNARAESMFGYVRGELVGRSVEELMPHEHRAQHPDHRRAFHSHPEARSMGSGRDLRGLRSDGSSFPIEVGLSPIRTRAGLFVLATITDLSERKRMEREAAQQRDELAHLSRVTMLGELSGSLAHELNQPLAAIISNAQAAQRFLQRDPVDLAEIREILADIIDNDRRAGEVIRRLRSLLRKEEAEFKETDINEAVSDVLRLMRSDLLNRGVDVRLSLTQDLPKVVGDRIQLQQVILNLIMNACDAMAGSNGERELSFRTGVHEGCVRTSVRDRGPGIPDELIGRMFDPFVTTKKEGMGLGLAVCKTIVEAHGGRIWAANDERGATVGFDIPLGGRA